jgi:hypothetical protein
MRNSLKIYNNPCLCHSELVPGSGFIYKKNSGFGSNLVLNVTQLTFLDRKHVTTRNRFPACSRQAAKSIPE